MSLFRKYFKVSAQITSSLCLLASVSSALSSYSFYSFWELVLQSLGLIFIGILPMVPFRLKEGFERNRRLAIGVSVFLTILFGWMLIAIFIDFVQTRGGEGPNGEGAPGALMIAMALFAALFVCPWLLTALRGVFLWSLPDEPMQQNSNKSLDVD